MIAALLKGLIVDKLRRVATRRARKIVIKKLRKLIENKVAVGGGITALIIGGVATIFGVELAPTEVDILVTAVAGVVAAIPVIKRVFGIKDVEDGE